MSLNTSLKSAMKSVTSEHSAQGVTLVLDMKDLDSEIAEQDNDARKMKARLARALNSIQELKTPDVQDFRLWHTNKEVRVIRFRVSKEAEGPFRQNAAAWIHTHFKGARLIGAKWYAVKADWVDKDSVSDPVTGMITEEACREFGEDNDVEVKQMKWLGRPKPGAQFASAVIKVASKEQAEKLLMARLIGKEVTCTGMTVEVSPFEDRRGPVICFRC
ncbi:hypothetical protein H2203_005240 [Taxawa tesnikishii (nom. ined.)]|nr:hypothetical protein H2203_005240 [Dothideales sp. JES 119]